MKTKTAALLCLLVLALGGFALAPRSFAASTTNTIKSVAPLKAHAPPVTPFWKSHARLTAYFRGERGVMDPQAKPPYRLLARAWVR